ncbi:MAG: hypothetical protein NVS1B7_7450 [Candidatus Saccharimonadales bacterium]
MLKSKLIAGCGLTVTVLVISGTAIWTKSHQRYTPNSSPSVNLTAGSDSVPLSAPRSVDAVPLSPALPPTSSDSSLHVTAASPADNLGQLSPSPASSSQANTPTINSPAKPSPFDPTTFSQYDKYKNDPGALFAEVQAGTGESLVANKKAAVYYRGWLTSGQVFDQSRTDSAGQLQPFIFTMGAHQVIPGWEQALSGMKVGGTRLVIVPPAVGYGSTGQGSIPPNAVLIFQVQLGAIQ